MQVARTTVQRIYEIARKKIADALIDGHPLRIEGGDFRICNSLQSYRTKKPRTTATTILK